MPKYFLSIVEDETAYAPGGTADHDAVLAAHGEFGRAVRAAGATVISGEALQPVSTATFLRGGRTGPVVVVDNPLPELKETLGGYYLIEAADDDVARALAEQCPAPHGYVELRPIWEIG